MELETLKFGRKAISVDEAQQIVLAKALKQEIEQVPLLDALHRRLAVDVIAAHPLPHFRRSGVDGYALRSMDVLHATARHPARLDVLETIPCGTVPQHAVGPGQASRIMTGAVVPDGADAVVMLEMTQPSAAGTTVEVMKPMAASENITPVGQETPAGTKLIDAGSRIGPGQAALLAAFGYGKVPVYRKPKVAVFATGTELLDVSAQLAPGKIRNSNSYMLACQVLAAGAEVRLYPSVADDPVRLEQALLAASEEADIFVTTGGVSVGDKDVLVELFARWDGELLFNKVLMRPGSPTSFGWWRGKPLFALSGNPGACFVGFELFVRPYIHAALGSAAPLPAVGTALLDADYAKGSAYPRYVRGTIDATNGCLTVRPAGKDKSSVVVSIKDAGCLIRIPAGGQGVPRGSTVRFLWLPQ